jgi:hypothetical protein
MPCTRSTPTQLKSRREFYVRALIRISIRRLYAVVAPVLFGAIAIGCAPSKPTAIPPTAHAPYAGYSSAKYSDPKLWLCRPDIRGDACHEGDLTATEIHPDGSKTILPYIPAKDPGVDCFYVYPTVDMGLFPYNHTDFDDLSQIASTTRAQVARFGETCAMYVPLYRQMSIGGYFWGAERREKYLDVAFSDVLDAFLHYMGQYNHGRRVVLIGHSQGAEMIVRLLRRVFETDPAMREKLVVALAIGAHVDVPMGKTSGASLPSIPLCTKADEVGCVIAYRSFRAGHPPREWNAPDPGEEAACVNPAREGSHDAAMLTTVLPSGPEMKKILHGIDDVTTPFVVYRDLYSGRCVIEKDGNDYFAIKEDRRPGDRRVAPFDIDSPALNTAHGMHILDLQLPQIDLVDLVKRKIAATFP